MASWLVLMAALNASFHAAVSSSVPKLSAANPRGYATPLLAKLSLAFEAAPVGRSRGLSTSSAAWSGNAHTGASHWPGARYKKTHLGRDGAHVVQRRRRRRKRRALARERRKKKEKTQVAEKGAAPKFPCPGNIGTALYRYQGVRTTKRWCHTPWPLGKPSIMHAPDLMVDVSTHCAALAYSWSTT